MYALCPYENISSSLLNYMLAGYEMITNNYPHYFEDVPIVNGLLFLLMKSLLSV